MSKKKKSAANWRAITPYIGAREWLRALGMIAAMALIACAAVFLVPARGDVALPIVVERVMTSNPSACYAVDGEYYDWLELKNISDSAVSLDGWRLTDSIDPRDAWTFGGVSLGAGESIVVYCDDAPEGYAGDALFTGFRLSSNGAFLMLADPRQRLSTLDVPPLGKTDVYQRDDATGQYAAVTFAEALGMDVSYASTLTPEYDPEGLMISEIMPSNHSTLPDADGDYSDWIELYNGSALAVDLEGYALSDNDANRQKWRFPAVTLQPGEYLVVFASGKDRADPAGELHANFRLSSDGEALRLYAPDGTALSYMQYETAGADQALSRAGDGAVTASVDPSPGHENTALGARAATMVMRDNALGLYVNEVLVSGKGRDWLELSNASDRAVDLSGMGLSDDPARPRKWQFPAGARIEAGGYLVIQLAGSPKDDGDGDAKPSEAAAESAFRADYTADFSLSSGETACLATAEGALIDKVKLYDQHRDVSYGRAGGHDRYRYFEKPTPGRANAQQSYEKVAKDIQFSTPPGIVREKRIQLEMTSDADVPIYYTTDGSEPGPTSKVYSGPITLDSNTCIKAVAWRQDVLQSPRVVASFIFGQHTLRLVSVTGKRSELNGPDGTLNTGAKKEGYDAFVEIYEPDGVKLVEQACHLTLAGHDSRTHYGQKSFRLTARRESGDTRFRAALFENRDYAEYKSIVLRASGQDCMQTKMRDSILTALAADTGVMYQETEPCVVYVNGSYWGLYNMRERVDEHSIAQFEGWSDPDSVVLGEGTGASTRSFQEMLRWVRSHDLSSDANIEALRRQVDIENYLDYVALEIYTCNQDLNNVRFYCSAEDPRWKWVLFDLDLSYQVDRNNVRDWLRSDKVGTITTQDATLFQALMKNAAMRDYFLTRMGRLLATTFSSQNVVEKIQARYTLIEPEMPLNCRRWNWKTGTWKNYVKKMVSYANERPAKLIGYFEDSFKLSKQQVRQYFGEALAKAGQ